MLFSLPIEVELIVQRNKKFVNPVIIVLRPTLLYISSEAVIPAKAGTQIEKDVFRIKSGLTIKVKRLLTQYPGGNSLTLFDINIKNEKGC
jgi:hypothetical protein